MRRGGADGDCGTRISDQHCTYTRLLFSYRYRSMLDMLMASSTKSDRRVNRPPSELSLDARALHDQLPDIEFLRANMIMFPLGDARCSQR
ncbi:hypothetical protein Y032_0044g968 [Ancylostoma ceylanicum]|uniref:Uncharacterized protein n=1 Tax=Ancylostoma ceylanicum TaxID=53326 RepID=A0A016UEV9_9BILA|nr:hypothetical protein Y032_0044g968 [Ancylostoma ceylanicum]